MGPSLAPSYLWGSQHHMIVRVAQCCKGSIAHLGGTEESSEVHMWWDVHGMEGALGCAARTDA